MPFTASKTADDTSAAWRAVSSGLVPVAMIVSLVIFIQSRTGSDAAAAGTAVSNVAAQIDNKTRDRAIHPPGERRSAGGPPRKCSGRHVRKSLVCLGTSDRIVAVRGYKSIGKRLAKSTRATLSGSPEARLKTSTYRFCNAL